MKAKVIKNSRPPGFFNKIEELYGTEVVRGPTWSWGDQDRRGPVGVIKPPLREHAAGRVNGWVSVEWSEGNSYWYRVGWFRGKFYSDVTPADKTEFVTSHELGGANRP